MNSGTSARQRAWWGVNVRVPWVPVVVREREGVNGDGDVDVDRVVMVVVSCWDWDRDCCCCFWARLSIVFSAS